jgi:hypothetical protein
MIVDQLFNNNNKTNESLADEFMKMAQAKGYNPRLRGTPDEERARTDAMLKQRAADRAAAPAPAAVSDEERAELQAKLKELQAQFDPNYEYSDDHTFWSQQNTIAKQIAGIKKKLSQGVAEGEQIDELSLDQIGRGLGSAARGASRAVGGLAGGIAGIPGAVKSGYRDAKNYVGGAAKPVAQPASAQSGANKQVPLSMINPATGKRYTYDELNAMAPAQSTAAATPTTATAPAATTAGGPPGFNASNVMKLPGMEKYAKKPAPAKTPGFAGPGGYSNVTTSFKAPAAAPAAKPAAAPAASAKPAVTPDGMTTGEYNPKTGAATLGGKTMIAMKDLPPKVQQQLLTTVKETTRSVKPMLESASSLDDAKKIKNYIDREFAKLGVVSESVYEVRNKMIEDVTRIVAVKRREHARKSS